VDVRIVEFPETRVAVISHVGDPSREHETARRLVAWKLAQGFTDAVRYRHYGLHFRDPRADPAGYRVDFCLSVEGPVAPNDDGIGEAVIPAQRCALARDVGSREDNRAARYLVEDWLPRSGEGLSGAPAIFHYVNVGPRVLPHEAITDVYLPLVRPRGA
jgi:AraC family transcriptional regulator